MMWKVSNNFEDFYLFDLEILGSSKVWLSLLLAHSFWHLKRASEIRIRIIVWVAFIRDVQIVPVSESWPLVVIVTDRRLMVVLFYLEFSFVTDREQKSFTVFKPATFWSPGYRLKATKDPPWIWLYYCYDAWLVVANAVEVGGWETVLWTSVN